LYSLNFVVYGARRQISGHPERGLNTLVVAGKLSERAIAQTLVEELGSLVPGPHFQGDPEYACDDGAFLEPLEKLAPDACPSIPRNHREKVQVRVVIAVAHDRKPGNPIVNARDHHVNILGANTRGYSHRCPTPL
jgi:hypothetical protein